MFCEEFCSIRSIKEGEEIYKDITSVPYQAVVINCLDSTSRDYNTYLMKYKIDNSKKVPKFKIESKFKKLFKVSGKFNFNFKLKP